MGKIRSIRTSLLLTPSECLVLISFTTFYVHIFLSKYISLELRISITLLADSERSIYRNVSAECCSVRTKYYPLESCRVICNPVSSVLGERSLFRKRLKIVQITTTTLSYINSIYFKLQVNKKKRNTGTQLRGL